MKHRLSQDGQREKKRQRSADAKVFLLMLAAAAMLFLAISTRFIGMGPFHRHFPHWNRDDAAASDGFVQAASDEPSHGGIEHFYLWLVYNMRYHCAVRHWTIQNQSIQ